MTARDDDVREQVMQAGGTPLRVAIRPGTGTGPPLLLCNGIGMRLEALQPFVDALDPAIEVIRFDAPAPAALSCPICRTVSPPWPCSCARCCKISATGRPTSWVSPGEAGWLSSSRCATRAGAGG